jgi:hypothetical protein
VDAREVGSAAATLAAEREGVDAGGRLGGLEREDGIVGGSIWFISGSWEARFGLFPSSSMSNFCSLAWGFFYGFVSYSLSIFLCGGGWRGRTRQAAITCRQLI